MTPALAVQAAELQDTPREGALLRDGDRVAGAIVLLARLAVGLDAERPTAQLLLHDADGFDDHEVGLKAFNLVLDFNLMLRLNLLNSRASYHGEMLVLENVVRRQAVGVK